MTHPAARIDHAALPPAAVCERARHTRDARFDGLFFIGVLSTGIYCRPVCPAPTAHAKNVRYFASAAQAAATGLRPCLRCRPELAPGAMAHRLGAELIDRGLALIDDGVLDEAPVSALAARLGVSARQLQRLFVEYSGVGPSALQRNRRLLSAKQLLTETDLPITDVALASGFGSVRRFNDAFIQHLGLTPTQLRHRPRAHASATTTLYLHYRPPFDFSLLCRFLAARAMPGLESVSPLRYQRLVGDATRAGVVTVSPAADRHALKVELSGLAATQIAPTLRGIRRLFDLDADLAPIHAVFARDPLLSRAIDRRPGLRVPGCFDPFELSVRAVLGQQISVAAATTLARRLLQHYGTTVSTDGALQQLFPSPAQLIEADLRSIGLTATRAITVRGLAHAVLTGELDFSVGQGLDDFVARAVALPGIGPWTAMYMAMRGLGHPDAFPSGDLIVRRVLGSDRDLSAREAETIAAPWRPWRAYAALHLWHLAGDAVPHPNPKEAADVDH